MSGATADLITHLNPFFYSFSKFVAKLPEKNKTYPNRYLYNIVALIRSDGCFNLFHIFLLWVITTV